MSVINCSLQESPFSKAYEIWDFDPDAVIIFPNHRSCRCFRQEVQKRRSDVIFPRIYSVTDLFTCDVNVVDIINILQQKQADIPLRTLCDLAEEIANTIKEIVLNKVDYHALQEKIPNLLQPYWVKFSDILQPVTHIVRRLEEVREHQIAQVNRLVTIHKTIAVELGRANKCITDLLQKISEKPNNTIVLLSLEAPINHKIKLPLLNGEEIISTSPHVLQNRIEQMTFQTENEEIFAAAVAIRRAVFEDKSVLAVTQSQSFTYRLKTQLMRWNIVPDTSLGTPLVDTPDGKLLILAAEVLLNEFDCNSLINLLKCRKDIVEAVYEFEIYRRKLGIAAKNFAKCYAAYKNKNENVQEILEKIKVSGTTEKRSFQQWTACCYQILEDVFGQANNIVQHTDFYRLLSPNIQISIEEFVTLLNSKILTQSQQQAKGYTKNVAIVGIIEAQLLTADVIIIANANAKNLTAQDNNIIMTKAMRRELGIPTSEQQNDFIASIFERLMNQKNVLVTRSVYADGGQQTEYPLLRNFTTHPCDLEVTLTAIMQNIPTIAKSKKIFPAPGVLPEKISASAVDLLIENPYAFYASNILKLKEIPSITGGAIKGNFIHEILRRFVRDKIYSAKALWEETAKIMRENRLQISDVGVCYFQLADLFDFLLKNVDREKKHFAEMSGKIIFQIDTSTEIILHCRADCLEVDSDGRCAIIDYKTYDPPSAKEVESLKKMQLPVEAIIAARGGFGDILDKVVSLQYWRVPNSLEIKEVVKIDKIENICGEATEMLKKSLDKSRTYELNPSDTFGACYKHLARYKEWAND